jgi:hypothetical protein
MRKLGNSPKVPRPRHKKADKHEQEAFKKAGTRKRILLVVDRAGWHTAKEKLKVPEGIHLEFLPSHRPHRSSNLQKGYGL